MADANLNVKVTQTGAGQVAKDISAIGKEASTAGYAVRSLNHLMGVLAVGMAIDKLISWGDEWQNIHNKLLNVTTSAANLTAVNNALFEGAQKSRTAYGEFVNVFQELAIQAKRFGTSQQDIVGITTTMMQAAQLAHPSIAAMKAGVEQLILTMERGKLTTRAFSALLKDTPQLAKALADGLGISIDKMRELASHSKVSGQQIVDAMKKAGPEVAQEFLKLSPTFDQAMTVMHNGWVKFVGDLDQSTGIIGGLTSLIIGLSNHVDVLAEAFVTLGAFASAALAGVARKAIMSMWAAFVAAGPVAWVLAAIAAIAGALVIFGDKVAVTQDGMVTLLDYVKGAFATIGDVISAVAGWLGSVWDVIEPHLAPVLDWVVSKWEWLAGLSWTIFKGVVNFIIGSFVFGYHTIVDTFTDLPGALEDIFAKVFNWISEHFASVVNDVIDGINKISNFAGMGSIGHMTGKHYTETGDAAKYGHEMGKAAGDAYSTDYVGAVVGAAGEAASWVNGKIMKHAREFSAARRANAGGTVSDLHGPPEPDDSGGKKKKPSRAKTRADLIAEETKKYVDQTALANDVSLTPWTDAAYKEVTRFNEQLMKTKDAKGHFMPGLSPEEKKSLLDLVQGYEDANRVQQERFSILNEMVGPQVKYNDAVKAATQLESAHMITAEQASRALRDAAIAFLGTKEDEASGAMLGQLDILKEMQDRAKPLADSMKSIWDAQNGPLQTYQTALKAINQLLKDQLITADQAADASRDAAISYLDGQTDAASGVTRALLKIQKTAEDAATQMEQSINDAFKGMEDAWVALTTGGKFDAKGALKTVQTDIAKSAFQKMEAPIAAWLQGRFGVSLPGIAGKVGESRANPMWVRSADSILPGQDQVAGGSADSNIQSIMDFLGVGTAGEGGASPLSGNTSSWDKSFSRFNGDLHTTMTTGSEAMHEAISGALQAGLTALGSMLGAKVGGIGGALIDIAGTVIGAFANHYATTGHFATGGAFTVGGSGGVDSQLVQFRASPGERVSIDRGGGGGGAGTVNYYDVHVDARGASDLSIEDRIHRAMADALPAAEKKTRQDALRDVGARFRRQQLPGGR